MDSRIAKLVAFELLKDRIDEATRVRRRRP